MGNATWFNYNCTGSTESNKYSVQKPESALFYTDRWWKFFYHVLTFPCVFFLRRFFYIYEMELSKKGRDGVTKDRSSA